MQWLGQLERTPPNSALLGKNLPFFRSCERHQRNVRVKSLGYRLLRCTYYELGPIGSGSAAPDVEEQAKRLKQANAQKGKKRSAEDIESAEGDKGYVPGPGHKIQWHPRAPKRPEREE